MHWKGNGSSFSTTLFMTTLWFLKEKKAVRVPCLLCISCLCACKWKVYEKELQLSTFSCSFTASWDSFVSFLVYSATIVASSYLFLQLLSSVFTSFPCRHCILSFLWMIMELFGRLLKYRLHQWHWWRIVLFRCGLLGVSLASICISYVEIRLVFYTSYVNV